MQFNTLYQLLSMVHKNDPQLETADTLLMMPDLYHYWLTGCKTIEFSIATTSQMYDIRQRHWATPVLAKLNIPDDILPAVVSPGTIVGQLPLALEIREGLDNGRPIVAVDSDSPLSDAYMAFARRTAGALSLMPRNRKLDLPTIQIQNR